MDHIPERCGPRLRGVLNERVETPACASRWLVVLFGSGGLESRRDKAKLTRREQRQ